MIKFTRLTRFIRVTRVIAVIRFIRITRLIRLIRIIRIIKVIIVIKTNVRLSHSRSAVQLKCQIIKRQTFLLSIVLDILAARLSIL